MPPSPQKTSGLKIFAPLLTDLHGTYHFFFWVWTVCTVRHHRWGVTKLCSDTSRTVWINQHPSSYTSISLHRQNSFWGVLADVTALSTVHRYLEIWDYQQWGATVLPPRSSHNVVGIHFTQEVAITLWSVSTQVPHVANQFGMVKFTVSKGITKTSKVICHLLSLIITFQYAAGSQRRRSLHAHSSWPKKTIQIVTEPFLPHDHQHLMGHASCPRGFSPVNLHHSRNHLQCPAHADQVYGLNGTAYTTAAHMQW